MITAWLGSTVRVLRLPGGCPSRATQANVGGPNVVLTLRVGRAVHVHTVNSRASARAPFLSAAAVLPACDASSVLAVQDRLLLLLLILLHVLMRHPRAVVVLRIVLVRVARRREACAVDREEKVGVPRRHCPKTGKGNSPSIHKSSERENKGLRTLVVTGNAAPTVVTCVQS